MLVLLLFFCSGATALIYEVIWSKYLTLMLGSTVQAQTVVLAVFMGGLALGNRIFGGKSTVMRDPLVGYGVLELVIGCYAFLFSRIYKIGDYTFVKLGSVFANTAFLLLILKLSISVLLLLIPTIFMGGTLPLLAAWLQRQRGFDAASRVGIFYAVNSLGAVLGAGLAGFVLIQGVGMNSSLELTGLANLFVGLFAVILARREEVSIHEPALSSSFSASAVSPEAAPASLRTFGLLVAFTGGVSMGLEVLSSRALALIAGGSLQAFAIVLMSFILGIGLGSVAISSMRGAQKNAVRTIYVLLIVAGALVVMNVLFIERITLFYAQAKYGLAPNHVGYRWHQVAIALASFVMLGLPAAFLGAVVPLSIRLATSEGTALGDRVGRLLTWNTCGAVAGVLITGFLLMPFIGLRGSLALLAVILIGAAGLLAFKRQQSSAFVGAIVLAIASASGVAFTGEDWRMIMGSGVYRIRQGPITMDTLREKRTGITFQYYKDSADATVSVEHVGAATNQLETVVLRINGKPDASTIGDLATQYLLAHLPVMARPDAKKVFVLGFGSGITSGALLGHPIEQLTIAENCRPVLEAAHLFGKWNHGVLTNARTRVRNDDARAVLKLLPDKYDVIISEPSNPWVAGIGSVFSREFYNICTNRLSDGGVMAQWFHKYEMNDGIVYLVLRTFASVFPYMEIWDSEEGDMILLGSLKPWESNPEKWQQVFDREQPRRDLAEIRITSPVALWARQIASQRSAFAIPGDGPVQTDEFPILEYAAPEAFFIGQSSERLSMFDERTVQFPLAESSKIRAMRSLSDKALVESFSFYGTENPDMKLYLTAVLTRAPGQPLRIDPMGHIIFRAPESYPETPQVNTNISPEFKTCIELEAKLLRDETNWKTHATEITRFLTGQIGQNKVQFRDFSPASFAALVARFAIGHGDYQLALEALRLGFVFNSKDEQLQFLSRVTDRIVPPEVMRDFRKRDKNPNL